MPLTTCLDAMHRASSARRDRRRLERELAAFTSAADLAELAALLEEAPAEAAEPIRDILDQQARIRLTRPRGGVHLFRSA